MLSMRSHMLCAALTLPWLGGCVSAPASVEADVPLVHASLAYSLDRDAIITPTGNLDIGNRVQLNSRTYQVQAAYVSATGTECRTLTLSSDEMMPGTERTLCQRSGQWVMLSPLVKHTESY
ncbi:hypothetical protein OCL06_09845 [Alteromonas sp. ASW11-19]|uniref:Common-antigen outer membrane protein n=1 Tax=Alteromonas salexigens TaxID=2982530 RepID=A0ABT2VNM1_9ALTE|nr:hypothetical protein [Alteromonas salexigens]MCU7554901.1 hypothetical protein [Alteromonas salexigens]